MCVLPFSKDISSSQHASFIPGVGDAHPPSPTALPLQNGLTMQEPRCWAAAGRAVPGHLPSMTENLVLNHRPSRSPVAYGSFWLLELMQ